jgi:hypothetical protein
VAVTVVTPARTSAVGTVWGALSTWVGRATVEDLVLSIVTARPRSIHTLEDASVLVSKAAVVGSDNHVIAIHIHFLGNIKGVAVNLGVEFSLCIGDLAVLCKIRGVVVNSGPGTNLALCK